MSDTYDWDDPEDVAGDAAYRRGRAETEVAIENDKKKGGKKA